MHDSFITEPALRCPLDGAPLENTLEVARGIDAWQGSSAPRALHLYRQGAPTFDRTSSLDVAEGRAGPAPMAEAGLPARFELVNVCGDHQVWAEGRLDERGIWAATEPLFVLGPDPTGEDYFGRDPIWGSRPAEPLWPSDAAVQLEDALAGAGLGIFAVSSVHHDGCLTVLVPATTPPSRRALVPARFAGREVVVLAVEDAPAE